MYIYFVLVFVHSEKELTSKKANRNQVGGGRYLTECRDEVASQLAPSVVSASSWLGNFVRYFVFLYIVCTLYTRIHVHIYNIQRQHRREFFSGAYRVREQNGNNSKHIHIE